MVLCFCSCLILSYLRFFCYLAIVYVFCVVVGVSFRCLLLCELYGCCSIDSLAILRLF